MKKCLKCGTKFDDKFMFCPVCGEQLVPAANECPNCHAELAPDARFCPNCGTRIGEQPAPQPQPAPAPQPQPAPAPQQGYPQQPYPQQGYQQPQPQPYPQQQGYYGYQQPQPQPARQKNPYLMQTIMRFVNLGMFIIAAILYLVGVILGAVNGFFDFSAFQYMGSSIATFIFLYVFFYLSFIGFFVALGLGIAAIVKSFKDKAAFPPTKPLTAMIMFTLPLLGYGCFYGSSTLYQGNMGAAFIMYIVTIILAAITIIAIKVCSGNMSVKPIVANSLAGMAFLFIALAVAFGTVPAAAVFSMMLMYGPDAFISNGQFFLVLGAFLLGFAGLILMFIAVPKPLKREKGIKGTVVLSSLSVGFQTIAFILIAVFYGMNHADITGEVIVPFVMLWVFFIFAIGLLIAASKVDPVAPAFPPRPQPYQPQPQPQNPYRY